MWWDPRGLSGSRGLVGEFDRLAAGAAEFGGRRNTRAAVGAGAFHGNVFAAGSAEAGVRGDRHAAVWANEMWLNHRQLAFRSEGCLDGGEPPSAVQQAPKKPLAHLHMSHWGYQQLSPSVALRDCPWQRDLGCVSTLKHASIIFQRFSGSMLELYHGPGGLSIHKFANKWWWPTGNPKLKSFVKPQRNCNSLLPNSPHKCAVFKRKWTGQLDFVHLRKGVMWRAGRSIISSPASRRVAMQRWNTARTTRAKSRHALSRTLSNA